MPRNTTASNRLGGRSLVPRRHLGKSARPNGARLGATPLWVLWSANFYAEPVEWCFSRAWVWMVISKILVLGQKLWHGAPRNLR